MSIRTRFLIVSCTVIFIIVGALSFAGYTLTSRFLLNEVDKSLESRATLISELIQSDRRILRNGGRLRNPITEVLLPTKFDSVTQVISKNGEVIVGIGVVDLPISPVALDIASGSQFGTERATVEIDGQKYRMITVPIMRGVALQIAHEIEDIEQAKSAIQRFGIFLMVGGMFSLAIFSWFSARQITRPLKNLADTLEGIAKTHDLDVVVEVDGYSEIRKLTSSFNSMTAALRQSKDQQKRLVQDASHELRTPLTSLRANSELLQRPDLEASARDEVLRDIRIEIDGLSALASELSALASDQKLDEAPLDTQLGAFVEEVVSRMSRRFAREITLEIIGSSTVALRQSQFDRALSNLIDNAVKFSPNEKPIRVIVRNTRVEVQDSGPGVTDADKPFIFDRFFRATQSRSMPGSGLGLAIVKQFADDHNAQIGVLDAPTGGTIVFIEFAA